MDDRENRRLQMFQRVSDFGAEHATDFAIGSLGTQLFTTLNSIVNSLDSHAASEVSTTGVARQGTTSRAQARQALREDLEAINRTARAMANEVAGLNDKFRLPPSGNDQLLLNAARAFAADAAPLSAQFIAHELPADFLDDLNDDITALERAISDQSSGVGQRIAAGAAIDEKIEEGVGIVRRLDAIVKNKYANNAGALAQWASASHTERSPRRRTTASPSPPSAPSSAPGSGSTPTPTPSS